MEKYNLTVRDAIEDILNKISKEEGLTKDFIFRQAILLYEIAYKADKVVLETTKNGEKKTVEIILK